MPLLSQTIQPVCRFLNSVQPERISHSGDRRTSIVRGQSPSITALQTTTVVTCGATVGVVKPRRQAPSAVLHGVLWCETVSDVAEHDVVGRE